MSCDFDAQNHEKELWEVYLYPDQFEYCLKFTQKKYNFSWSILIINFIVFVAIN